MTSHPKAKARYLWSFLLALGFEADSVGNKRHVVLGETMFDKPNKDAFYIVIHFLLEKLNPSRMREEFRHCFPVVDRKQDAEFRKLTLARLQEITDESGGSFPKVLSSHLLSPSGPKFIHIMLSLARHVMLQDIKTFHTDGSWAPKAIAVPASCLETAEKRFQVARSSHLVAVVARDRLHLERQQRLKSMEKSVRDLMAKNAKYKELLESQEGGPEQDGSLPQSVQKARCLWAEVETALASLREKQRIVDRVLQGDVDKHVLDGADVKLKVPSVLQERMDKMAEETSRGSQCDRAQPSLLHLLELLNEALAILNEERVRAMGPTAELRAGAQSVVPTVQVDGEALQQHMAQMAQAQEDLRELRARLSTEDIPSTRSAIRDAEASWDRKWEELLQNSILATVMSADPGVDLLPAMTALSFEPAPEDRLKTNVLFQPPPASAEPEKEKPQRSQRAVVEMVKPAEEQQRFYSIPNLAEQSSDEELESVPAETSVVSCVIECPRPTTPLQPAPAHPPQKSPPASAVKDNKTRPADTQTKMSAVKKKADILDMEFDNLAEQFAQAVTTTPKDGSEGGVALEQLLNSMIEPLSARKQLPRTPESLIADVRTSWRKAVEDGMTQRVRPPGKSHDSFSGLFTPLSEASRTNVSADVSSLSAPGAPASTTLPLHTPGGFYHPPTGASAPRSPNQNQQGAEVPFTGSFHSSHMAASANQRSNEGFEFSIANETLPELSNSNSLLGNNDSILSISSQDPSQEEEEERPEEEEELILPQVMSPPGGGKMAALLSARQRLQSILEKASRVGPKHQELLPLSPTPGAPGQGNRGQETGEWEAPQQVFSLDLDQLESLSPPHHGDMHLPNLLTFSPVDQL